MRSPNAGRTNELGGSVPRSVQDDNLPVAKSRTFDSNALRASAKTAGMCHPGSRITALSIEFVAKPNEAHKVQAALPAGIDGAFGEIAGFAGSFVMVANHEARLVTVVTLWIGEDRLQRCNENVRWVRALLAPYLDRCLRVQTLAAFVPGALQFSQQFEQPCIEGALARGLNEEESMCVA